MGRVRVPNIPIYVPEDSNETMQAPGRLAICPLLMQLLNRSHAFKRRPKTTGKTYNKMWSN